MSPPEPWESADSLKSRPLTDPRAYETADSFQSRVLSVRLCEARQEIERLKRELKMKGQK